jgi:prepilin-type N-terminal cleavage/methylation domain-containing protein
MKTNGSGTGGTKGRWRGFTVIEMVMVVVMIGIVARFAIPMINYTHYRADAAGRLCRILLQEAQRNAITRQSNVIVSFDLVLNRYRIVQDYNNNDTINTTDLVSWRNLPEHAEFAKPPWSGAMGEEGNIPTSGINGSQLQTVSGLLSIIFRRDGSSSSDLQLYVTTNAAVPTEYREVYVTESTGRPDLYRYTGKASTSNAPTSNGWLRMTQ